MVRYIKKKHKLIQLLFSGLVAVVASLVASENARGGQGFTNIISRANADTPPPSNCGGGGGGDGGDSSGQASVGCGNANCSTNSCTADATAAGTTSEGFGGSPSGDGGPSGDGTY